MYYSSTQKIPGGKLLRLKIEANGTIEKINITGDFFLHPEEALPYIEKALAGLSTNSSTQEFAQKIEKALIQQNAAFIGVNAQDIAQLITATLSPKN